MKWSTANVWIAVVFASLGIRVLAQDTRPNVLSAGAEMKSPPASIDELAWIAGHWQGEAMEGRFEETWNAPMGGTMQGMFKFVKDDQIGFYELMTIAPVGDSLSLRIKHFSADLNGWEEQDKFEEFRLLKLAEQEAFFDGLTFRKLGPDELEIYVLIGKENGTADEVKFPCRRVNANKSAKGQAAVAVRAVLDVDTILGKQRDHLCETESLETAVRAYVLALDHINFKPCPADFVTAFHVHREAWQAAIPFLQRHNALRGEMHELFNKIRELDEANRNELESITRAIFASWTDVEKAAAAVDVR